MPEHEYPAIEKMHAVVDKSQAIGEFLEWLSNGEAHKDEHGECPVHLAHRFLKPRYGYEDVPWDELNMENIVESEVRTAVFTYSTERLLAKFLGIDLDEVEREKRSILLAAREKSDESSM